jgi:hypothetical protein
VEVMLGGIFDTIATVGTASAVSEPAKFPVDMQPKPIGGPVVGPAVPPPTQGEQTQMAQGLILLLSSSRAVKPEAAQQLAFAIAAVCGPSSALTPAQQGQAVNQILSSSTAVDKAQVPTLYGLVSMFIGQQPVAARRAARRERGRKVIGESIFGNYLFANDALPQQVEQPWALPTEPSADQPEPVGPRGMSGFGTDVPVDHSIPTGMKWLGHGIMGGRTRHGGYGVSRYGEPVTGYGAMGAYDPTPDKLAVGTGPGGSFVGNQGCRMPTPTGTSTWPALWACNAANFKAMLKTSDSYRPTNQKLDDPNGWYANTYIDAVLAGKLPQPDGFPPAALPKGTAPTDTNTGFLPPPVLPPPVLPPPVMMAPAESSTAAGTAAVVGVGVLALLGGVFLMKKGKKKSVSAPAKVAG